MTIKIFADGKCRANDCQLEEIQSIIQSDPPTSFVLEIDASKLLGGSHTSTLLGKNSDFLSASLTFEIKQFEPLENGLCRIHYERKTALDHSNPRKRKVIEKN